MRQRILQLLGEGASYQSAAAELGISPGQAYLVATGLPADGGDGLAPEDRRRPGVRTGSVQELVNPRVHAPSKSDQAVAFLRQRVAKDAPMQDAARRRDASPPELELPEDDDAAQDVVDVLGRDHIHVKYLLEQLEAIPKFSEDGSERDAERRQSILDMMIVALSGHEAAEEAFFWPAVRQWLGDEGGRLAEEATSDEQRAKETIAELEGLPGTDEGFDELVEQLSSQLRSHVAFEDRVLLQVKQLTATDQRVEVGRNVLKAKRYGPTHPHPKARSSAASQRLGPAVGAIDRVKDAVTGRPAERRGQAADEVVNESE